MPEGVTDYIEDFDYFKNSVKLIKERLGKDRLIIPPHVRIINPSEKILNTLPSEIVFNTKPDDYDFHRAKNLRAVNDKNDVLYDNSKKIADSKNIFKI